MSGQDHEEFINNDCSVRLAPLRRKELDTTQVVLLEKPCSVVILKYPRFASGSPAGWTRDERTGRHWAGVQRHQRFL